jgi:hypothetical protein
MYRLIFNFEESKQFNIYSYFTNEEEFHFGTVSILFTLGHFASHLFTEIIKRNITFTFPLMRNLVCFIKGEHSLSVFENRLLILRLNTNSVALVRERTIPTERPPFVGEVNANFCG